MATASSHSINRRSQMKAVRILLLTFLGVNLAIAQTKISGTAQCGKPEKQQSMDVGDRAHHSFIIGQGKCTWTKPLEIEGARSQGGTFTVFSEQSGNTVRDHGYVMDTMDSGDTSIRCASTARKHGAA